LLFGKKPWVIAHHTWITEDFRGSIKRQCALNAHNISISQAVATHLRVPSTLIPNPYDDDVFREPSDRLRDQDLIFVGRLVSQKGVDCLLSALHLLKQRGITPNLTVVGAGPEERRLQQLASELKIIDQIDFVGIKVGSDLANELSRHKILVLPTLIQEPFGVVALEAIASGCVVVGSRGGGLKDAIGPCGVTFPNGNSQALADCLADLLSDEAALRGFRENAAVHLSRHTKARVASKYLAVVQSAVQSPNKVSETVVANEDGC
jgi:glycosyltransferase involved in cell wall biosynthesis